MRMRHWMTYCCVAALFSTQLLIGSVALASDDDIQIIRSGKLRVIHVPEQSSDTETIQWPPAKIPGANSPLVMPTPGSPQQNHSAENRKVSSRTPLKISVEVSQAEPEKGETRIVRGSARMLVDDTNEQDSHALARARSYRPKKRMSLLQPMIAGETPQLEKHVAPIANSAVADRSPNPLPLRNIKSTKKVMQASVNTASKLAPVHAPEIDYVPPDVEVKKRSLYRKLPKVKFAVPSDDNAQGGVQPIPSFSDSSASGYISDQDRAVNLSPIRRMAGEQEIIVDNGASNLNPIGSTVMIPIESAQQPDNVELIVSGAGRRLIATNAELADVLRYIAHENNLNLILGPNVRGTVTASIEGARLEEILDAILGVNGYAWHRVDNLLYVTSNDTPNLNPRVQGRTVRVYPLDYVAASDVESVANRLLSPVGNAFISEAASDDQTKTREVLIVDDTEDSHSRIAAYVSQIDVAPRQVLVEAHVLQIALNDDERHGINLRALARFEGANLSLEGSGFASDNVGGPSLALRVDGTDMDSLVEMIRQNTNSRTLASPKVSVVNHQEARIQIGQRLPYAVATTTQTSTVQSVEFLEVGIVLTVRPIITEDGNVLMTVLPKVSGGRITENGFPEEDTTELSTTILMPDGGGVVIGGLIREEDVHTRSLVPGLGKVPVVGHLFQRRTDEVRRNELVIALVTHVMPDIYSARSHEMQELQNTLPEYATRELVHPETQMYQPGTQMYQPEVINQAVRQQPTQSNSKPIARRPTIKSRRR